MSRELETAILGEGDRKVVGWLRDGKDLCELEDETQWNTPEYKLGQHDEIKVQPNEKSYYETGSVLENCDLWWLCPDGMAGTTIRRMELLDHEDGTQSLTVSRQVCDCELFR